MEIFVKAICFEDVQVGDVVCEEKGGTLLLVEKTGYDRGDPLQKLYLVGKVYGTDTFYTFRGEPKKFIGLVYQPRPVEETWVHRFMNVLDASRSLVAFEGVRSIQSSPEYLQDRDEHIRVLREVLDIYELGKSLESSPEPKAEPTKVRSVRLDDPAGGC